MRMRLCKRSILFAWCFLEASSEPLSEPLDAALLPALAPHFGGAQSLLTAGQQPLPVVRTQWQRLRERGIDEQASCPRSRHGTA
ncbi:MAG: hypothetical protein ACJAUC_002804 [Planctomycetota bacterium]|jgi:hypothetical protein